MSKEINNSIDGNHHHHHHHDYGSTVVVNGDGSSTPNNQATGIGIEGNDSDSISMISSSSFILFNTNYFFS